MTAVLVLGNAGMDLTLALPQLARPGETVVASGAARAPGGKGLNQAVVAARAGGRVRFCAPIGDDPEARLIAAALAREPFAELRLLRAAAATDQSIVMVAADGENSIVTVGAAADALTAREAAAFAGSGAPGDWLLLQGNLSEAATLAAIRAARGPVMLNAAPLRWPIESLLPLCQVLVVNRQEAAAVTGCEDAIEATAWFQAHGCRLSIVTLGREGCVWSHDGVVSRLPAHPVAVVDTTGAGDTLCGVLVTKLARGEPIASVLVAAQAAAAVTVSRPGAFAALPSVAELRSA